jgi:hypothetical protein
MDPKELRGLYEAYSEVYAPREEEIEEDLRPLPKEKMARQAQKAQGMENRAAAAGDEKETNRQMQRRLAMQMPSSRRTVLDKKKMGEEVEIFDVVLEFLQVEGYAETLEEAEWLMANMIDEEAIDIILGEEQLDEISQKTATRAYAQSYTGEFEGHDDESSVKRTDRLKGHIERKFGKKAGEDADRHADSETFGRKDPRTGKRQPKPESRFQNANKYRTRSDGKMHGQDQNKLKAKLKRRIGEEYMDEAQEARNNPEKYEREQSKKTAPVRGERTPMPPRGDKRREDFEKWYAANVR